MPAPNCFSFQCRGDEAPCIFVALRFLDPRQFRIGIYGNAAPHNEPGHPGKKTATPAPTIITRFGGCLALKKPISPWDVKYPGTGVPAKLRSEWPLTLFSKGTA